MASKADKTEKPTAKRKKDARAKGQVARSAEVGGWFSLLVATMALPVVFHIAEIRILGLQTQVADTMANPSVPKSLAILGSGLTDFIVIALPFGLVMAILAAVAAFAQVGLVASTKAITPQFSKLNPINGIKRLFSPRGVWELIKSLLKLALITGLAGQAIQKLWHTLVGTQPVAMSPLISFAGTSLMGFVRTISVVGLVMGLADYAFQKYRLNKDLMMSKQEIKEERRQEDGDPAQKGNIRRRQRSMSRLRMMAEVARADLIVTNPTHVAVALRYDKARSSAPRVVAKGADEVAARIRAEAAKHQVPMVEDRPLARAVYAACEVGDQIPQELYVAVARLLAFVYSLSPALRSARPVHRRPVTAMVA